MSEARLATCSFRFLCHWRVPRPRSPRLVPVRVRGERRPHRRARRRLAGDARRPNANRHARAREDASGGGDVHRSRGCARGRVAFPPPLLVSRRRTHTRNRAPVLADSLAFPPSLRRSAFPHDHVVNAAAAVGAAGSLGVLAGVYRVRLNRCRCSKAERAEVKQGGAFAMHCRRCLKRTNKGVFVSFLTSPLYVAGAAVGLAHCAHALGTPMVKGAARVRASRR